MRNSVDLDITTMMHYVFLLTLALPAGLCRFPDWLVTDFNHSTQLTKGPNKTLSLSNGLISRKFITYPDFATVDYYSHEKQSSLLRAVGPEAVISIDEIPYNIGGILSDMPRAYLNHTALSEDMRADHNAFHMVRYETRPPQAPYPYIPARGAPKNITWPPKGLRLDVTFRAPFAAPKYHQMVTVVVHYEMYDGIPLMTKWVSITADKAVQNYVSVSLVSVEYLAVNWQWSQQGYNWFVVEADWPHAPKVQWAIDPSQPSMPGSFEAVVNCTYSPITPVIIGTGLTSYRALELIVGSSDPERTGLARHRMLRLLAPQTWENPLYFHIVTSNTSLVRPIIDQIANVGFEMLIYSFGSRLDIESANETYIKHIADDVAYAHQRGIEVGAYDLISWDRGVPEYWKAIETGSEHGACFASGWYDYLFEHVSNFMKQTGMTAITTDGPYPGYSCSSTNHSHHKGRYDSVFHQTQLQSEFYRILRTRGVYINQPDDYMYQGGSRRNIGYNEHQYSLPRWQDLSISRQGLYDDTFRYPPTAGWMFLPISMYHGGGGNATFEPLHKHMVAYDWALAQHMGAGVGVVYRGNMLYDTEPVLLLVRKWVDFYKMYRDILRSDLIHVRRADMQGMDCYMHVNPKLARKALVMVFNPTGVTQSMNLSLPLYYSGLSNTAVVSELDQTPKVYSLARDYSIDMEITLKAISYTWYVIR